MSDMDTKKIHALLTADEEGSLTAAAEVLGYTQSGMTHMMNSLEDELGLSLLIRSKLGVRLSPAAQALREDFEALVKASDILEQDAARMRQKNFKSLRLGAYSSVVRNWMPSVLTEFRTLNPETEVSMDAGSIKEIYSWMKEDMLDCAIVSYQQSLMAGLSWVPLREDPLVAVVPADYAAELEAFPVENFSGREFLMPSACFDMDINPVFHSAGEDVKPRISYTNLDDAAIVSMVEHGLGISILSELVTKDMPNDVRILPLSPPASRSLGIILSEKRQNDRNIRQFIRCIQSVLGRMYRGSRAVN